MLCRISCQPDSNGVLEEAKYVCPRSRHQVEINIFLEGSYGALLVKWIAIVFVFELIPWSQVHLSIVLPNISFCRFIYVDRLLDGLKPCQWYL